jgi:hypothetical protein
LFKKYYIYHIVLVLYLFISVIVILQNTKQTYGVNDDVIIQNWLSGFYTGTPELMIRGSATPRISFGFIVSTLYQILPGINWFPILLLFLVLTSWYLLGLLALRSKDYLVVVTYMVISFLHLIWFIPSPTYTASAAILSFSVLIFISKQILEEKLKLRQFPIAILYFLSFSIRPESFLLGTAIAIPFLLFTILKMKNQIKANIKVILTFILMAISLIGSDAIIEKLYYANNSNWAVYKEWESARYKIQANAPEMALQSDPTKYGWTRASVKVFENYNYIDSNYFSAKRFNELISDTNTLNSISLDDITKGNEKIFDQAINYGWSPLIQMIPIFFIIFFILSFPKPTQFLVLALTSQVFIYVIMLYIAIFLRQPERVQVTVIFFSILVNWVSFVFVGQSNSRSSFNQFTIVSWLVFYFVAMGFISQASYLKLKYAGAPNVFWINQSAFLETFPPESIFVGNASQFRSNWISPYKLRHFEVEKRILSFGWHNFSPHWVKRVESFDLNPSDLLTSIIQDPRVYWVSDADSMNYIVEYMKEQNYDFSGPFVVGEIDYVGNDYKVWDFKPND